MPVYATTGDRPGCGSLRVRIRTVPSFTPMSTDQHTTLASYFFSPPPPLPPMGGRRRHTWVTAARAEKMKNASFRHNVRELKKRPAKVRRLAAIKEEVKKQLAPPSDAHTWLKELGPKFLMWHKAFEAAGVADAKAILTLQPERLDAIVSNVSVRLQLRRELEDLKKRNPVLVEHYTAALLIEDTKKAEVPTPEA